jgi:hypothetical protein
MITIVVISIDLNQTNIKFNLKYHDIIYHIFKAHKYNTVNNILSLLKLTCILTMSKRGTECAT